MSQMSKGQGRFYCPEQNLRNSCEDMSGVGNGLSKRQSECVCYTDSTQFSSPLEAQVALQFIQGQPGPHIKYQAEVHSETMPQKAKSKQQAKTKHSEYRGRKSTNSSS